MHGGCKTVSGVMDKTRAGKGCGTCKGLVAQLVEHAAGGAVEEDPAARYYVPGIPMAKAPLMEIIREQRLMTPSAVFAALAPGRRGGREVEDGARLAAQDDVGRGRTSRRTTPASSTTGSTPTSSSDGTFSVVPQMRGGVTTAEQLRRIADVADKYEVPMVKLTGGQRIDLLGIRKEDLPGVWADLDMPSGYAYGKSFRTVKTCVGQEFCRFGTGDSTKLGRRARDPDAGHGVAGQDEARRLRLPPQLRGVALQGRRHRRDRGRSLGDLRRRRRRRPHPQGRPALHGRHRGRGARLITGRFLQYYRESASWLERTYAWVPRVGIEHIRAVVVDDSEGIAERLDAAVQLHADTYVDPWTQGREPVTPGQFRTALPLEVLPHVPADRADRAAGRCLVSAVGRGPGPASSTGWARSSRSRTARRRAFDVAGEQVAVFRLRDGRVRALSAVCPHSGGPIADGQTDLTGRALPAAPERLRARHRLLHDRRRTAAALRRRASTATRSSSLL